MTGSLEKLAELGATSAQVVDLADTDSPRTLRYRDLIRDPPSKRAPLVIEVQGQPLGYVFDPTPEPEAEPPVERWIRRVAFRGDAHWVGVLRPGRLDVFPAVLDGQEPSPLPDLPSGPMLLPHLIHARHARTGLALRSKLLELLSRSIEKAKSYVDAADALSLVGRALFWRFLIDRKLLHGVNVDDVCAGARSWEDCFATKKHALRTFAWLNKTFNGDLLPIGRDEREIPANVYSEVLGNIAHLATAEGQLSLRLPDEWNEVNFAHVPVGLLSEVYEAYAHAEDATRAKRDSIFYTPRHLAEWVVDEALAAVEDLAAPRVLDPAAGAGVFLVAAFRALVARAWSRSGRAPSRAVVRRILNEQLVGFDINEPALRLAELALYLTAIELDPDRSPRPLSLLRFEALRDRVLILKPGGHERGSLGPVEPAFQEKFDVVIGNPPWTSKTKAPKAAWVDATSHLLVSRLGEERASEFDFADRNPDVPFLFRAMEWARPGGCIALLMHARWLFSQTSSAKRVRADVLDSVHVTGILNGTALRDTSVWPNVRAQFCVVFAANERPPPGATMLFVSPELDKAPDREQERLRIDWKDATPIELAEIVRVPWTLKARFRGTAFDVTVLEHLQRRGIALGEYLSDLGTRLMNGYQTANEARDARDLHGLPDLKGHDLSFVVPHRDLPPFKRRGIYRAKSRDDYRAPLLLIDETFRADPSAPRSGLALEDVAYDERFNGVSFTGIDNGAEVACYLQVFIQSSLFRHALLLLDGQLGVERDIVHRQTIASVPVLAWSDLSPHQREAAAELSQALSQELTQPVADAIDEFAFELFGLSRAQRDSVTDTLAIGLPTAGSKALALRSTTPEERARFTNLLETELNEVLAASKMRAVVRECDDCTGTGLFRMIQVDRVPMARESPRRSMVSIDQLAAAADWAAASAIHIRVGRDIRIVGQLDRYRYWTKTRARLLAASLLSELEMP